MVQSVRQQEEILLHGQGVSNSEQEDAQVSHFLREEYERECLDYPGVVPAFDANAALWAARLLHVAANLVLYRKDTEEKLGNYIIPYPAAQDASSMLSADLMLRFLPDLIKELEHIDQKDPLIHLLKQVLLPFPYSAMIYPYGDNEVTYSLLTEDKCVAQLAVNRIMTYRRTEALQNQELKALLTANVGMYAGELLGNFEIENSKE